MYKMFVMKEGTRISAIMTRNVVTVQVTDPLERAEQYFKKKHIRHIPVIEKGLIAGMLSYNDLLRISFADSYSLADDFTSDSVYDMFSIDQVMVKNLTTVTPDMTVRSVAQIFTEKEFHALPVVEDDQLVGIITTTDVINFLLDQYE